MQQVATLPTNTAAFIAPIEVPATISNNGQSLSSVFFFLRSLISSFNTPTS